MTVLSKLSRSSTSTSAKAKRKPVRKALLVAITYKEKQEGIDELRSPRKDARDWRDLLLSTSPVWIFVGCSTLIAIHFDVHSRSSTSSCTTAKYKFRECDITTMLDDEGVPEHLLPTRENIVSSYIRDGFLVTQAVGVP